MGVTVLDLLSFSRRLVDDRKLLVYHFLLLLSLQCRLLSLGVDCRVFTNAVIPQLVRVCLFRFKQLNILSQVFAVQGWKDWRQHTIHSLFLYPYHRGCHMRFDGTLCAAGGTLCYVRIDQQSGCQAGRACLNLSAIVKVQSQSLRPLSSWLSKFQAVKCPGLFAGNSELSWSLS